MPPLSDRADWYFSGVDRTYKAVKALLNAQSLEDFGPVAHEDFREQDFGSLIGKKHACPTGWRDHRSVYRQNKRGGGVKHKAISFFSHGGTIRASHVALNGRNAGEFAELYYGAGF